MNILKHSILLVILLKCVIASENLAVKDDVIKAVDESGFESIKRDLKDWWNRKDLFDHVVTKSVEFIAGFINQVESAKRPTLAALFTMSPEMAGQVLKKIKYNDDDLRSLTNYRHELAESHDGFFKAMDMINDPEIQKWTVELGVMNLSVAERYDYVIHLIDSLGKRQFNGRKLKNVAVQCAFYEGALRGIKYFAEEFYEHPAITSERYVDGLINSWMHDKAKTAFPILLSHADQCDLEKAKEDAIYRDNAEFRDAIDDAIPNAGPLRSRIQRPKRRVELVKEAFSETASNQLLAQEKGPGDIILGYLGESEGTEGGKGQ
jgi:hypothetical protein